MPSFRHLTGSSVGQLCPCQAYEADEADESPSGEVVAPEAGKAKAGEENTGKRVEQREGFSPEIVRIRTGYYVEESKVVKGLSFGRLITFFSIA